MILLHSDNLTSAQLNMKNQRVVSWL